MSGNDAVFVTYAGTVDNNSGDGVFIAISLEYGRSAAAWHRQSEKIDKNAAVAHSGILVDESPDAESVMESLQTRSHCALGLNNLQTVLLFASELIKQAVKVRVADRFGDSDHSDSGVVRGHKSRALP